MSILHRVPCVIVLVLLLSSTASVFGQRTAGASEAQAPAPPPEDLMKVEEPRRPHLSPDGRSVLVQTRRASVEKNRYAYSVWRVPTDTTGAPVRLDLPKRAHAFEWMPSGHRIAFLAPTERGNQVWTKQVGADSARQVTEKNGGIESFSVSPDGEQLAYTTKKRPAAPSGATSDSLHGVVVDMRSFRARQLRDDQLGEHSQAFVAPATQLWLRDLGGGGETKVSDSLTVEEYRWSPSGKHLALTGVPVARKRAQAEGLILYRTDLYVYERASETLRRLHKGHQDTTRVWAGTISYSSPFWSPSGNRVGFLRTDESDRFASVAEVGVHDLDRGTTRYVTDAEDQELDGATFHWITPDTLLVGYTHRARSGLFRLSLDDGDTAPVWTPDRDAGGFSFSADNRQVAWVEQSVAHPPEIYTARRSFDAPRRISSFNRSLREFWRPTAESITWTSTDGTSVQGWLIRPRSRVASASPPLLVYVHGGPGAEMNNQFLLNRGWGRPVQTFAARGYAVFIPNYRQSDSFGKAFQKVDALDKEPVADIVTGIEHLVAEGEADPDRIGILGNSWGGWLGPLVVAEKPIFQAASFAEGVRGNALSSYGHGYGWAARGLQEYYVGSTPYENPERYLELSSAFRDPFTKTTPTLLEYGQNSGTVVEGIEVGRALWRHGTPHEVVIYPGAGHGLQKPALLVESMRRNLQWFERWLPAGASSSETQ